MSQRTQAPVRTGDLVDVEIERLTHGGRGIARLDNFVLFVGRSLPGDKVRARVTRVKRSFAEANAEELLEAGAQNVDPQCDPAGACGACTWQRLPYELQLQYKADLAKDAIVRLGGVVDPPMLPIVGMAEPTGYRNKVEYTFAADPATGVVMSGYHRFGSWEEIVEVDECLIADPRGNAAKHLVDAWARKMGFKVYDRETGKGLLRSLIIRVGHATGEIQVNVVTGPTEKGLPRAAELVDDLEAGVTGLVGVLHTQTGSRAESSFSEDPPTVLWGRDWYEERMGGKTLKIRSNSFLQTNTAQANVLYDLVLDVAKPRPDDIAYDLYCGLGSITLALAPHVQEVVGVEVVQEAIDCAVENAELNGVDNVEWQVGNVRPVLKAAQGVWPDPTLIVVDPPRAGLVPKVVQRICEARPERIVYVSCNPTTFAGNLPQFREFGYQPVSIQPIDQFPFTSHVELVARFEPIPGWEPPTEEELAAREAERLAAKNSTKQRTNARAAGRKKKSRSNHSIIAETLREEEPRPEPPTPKEDAPTADA
ncbi:MAG: 23S rRNA (uracil(1939)-C(5))-methyltransferase RlmD [Thermoleophilia bacterium]|nr:23S rRNA (uracil(1939)-C(5))-methyltransferase RlmD [Thermoleophilia bacterium]